MLFEVILLIFLCRKIGNTAERKGLKPGQWKLITVLAWFGFEFLGLMIGIMLFGYNVSNLYPLLLLALVSGFGGYLLVKASLDKRPDSIDEDEIENIGNSRPN